MRSSSTELSKARQVVGVVLGHREAHADLEPEVAAKTDTLQGLNAPSGRRNLSWVAPGRPGDPA